MKILAYLVIATLTRMGKGVYSHANAEIMKCKSSQYSKGTELPDNKSTEFVTTSFKLSKSSRPVTTGRPDVKQNVNLQKKASDNGLLQIRQPRMMIRQKQFRFTRTKQNPSALQGAIPDALTGLTRHNEPTTHLCSATTCNLVKSPVICYRCTTFARQSHDILSIVTLSFVVGRKSDMYLFALRFFVVLLSCCCRESFLLQSCDCLAIKHNVVGTNINNFNKNKRTTVARHSLHSRTIVSQIQNFVRCSHNIDCLSYDSGTFVLQHDFVLSRRIQLNGRRGKLFHQKDSAWPCLIGALPDNMVLLVLIRARDSIGNNDTPDVGVLGHESNGSISLKNYNIN
ncbi:Hypothetical predicted protein [Mytilus galloprovincialis]|uniref:Uncharacterized protein n=1 Tax=Mytilus galloprovincialis TaxID=29158 RepID=A0A8B6H2E0_MYTGA|nr:Hypothetical predicted protein [Mytilus galloprovincialis]